MNLNRFCKILLLGYILCGINTAMAITVSKDVTLNEPLSLIGADIDVDSVDIEPTTKTRYIGSPLAFAINTKEMYRVLPFHYGNTVKVIFPIVPPDAEFANILVSGETYAIQRKHLTVDNPVIDESSNKPKPKRKFIPVPDKATKNYAGKFQLTAYAWTGNRCANGQFPKLNYTVAAHKSDFPIGTKLYIEDYGVYTVEDRGGFPKGVIDVYLGEHNKCVKFGRKHGVNVYVLEYGKRKR